LGAFEKEKSCSTPAPGHGCWVHRTIDPVLLGFVRVKFYFKNLLTKSKISPCEKPKFNAGHEVLHRGTQRKKAKLISIQTSNFIG